MPLCVNSVVVGEDDIHSCPSVCGWFVCETGSCSDVGYGTLSHESRNVLCEIGRFSYISNHLWLNVPSDIG